MSAMDDVPVDTKFNVHIDDGNFHHHRRRRMRRPSVACDSGTTTDDNNFYLSEIDSYAIADGSLPVALTDEPLLEHNFSMGSPGVPVIPRGQHMLDCPVVPNLDDGEIDLEIGELELNLGNNEERGIRCRICHLNLEGNADDGEGNEEPDEVKIQLGCSCKGDLGVAHKQCAETWFQIKGNAVCEICGAVASNIVGEYENEAINVAEEPSQVSEDDSENDGFKHGHLLMTCLITFMALAFAIIYICHLKNTSRTY